MNLEVKTAPKADKPKNIFAVKENQRAILLVPYEDGPRERVAELLGEVDLLSLDEDDRKARGLPRIQYQIKLSKLTENDVIFTAVPVVAKMGARKQPSAYSLKVSKPLEVKKFIAGGEDGDPIYSAVVDALQSSILPLTARVGEDNIVKLYTA